MLTPALYLATIVLPTVAEFLADLSDGRRAYLACMATAHPVDQIRRSERLDTETVKKAATAIGSYKGEALEIVKGTYNGTEHAGTGRGEPFPFAPGHEERQLAHELQAEGGGEVTGLTVVHRDATYFIDDCVKAAIWDSSRATRSASSASTTPRCSGRTWTAGACQSIEIRRLTTSSSAEGLTSRRRTVESDRHQAKAYQEHR